MDQRDATTCPQCGALMGDPEKHRDWHDRGDVRPPGKKDAEDFRKSMKGML